MLNGFMKIPSRNKRPHYSAFPGTSTVNYGKENKERQLTLLCPLYIRASNNPRAALNILFVTTSQPTFTLPSSTSSLVVRHHRKRHVRPTENRVLEGVRCHEIVSVSRKDRLPKKSDPWISRELIPSIQYCFQIL